ncbi:WD40 repeat-like protein [Exidia glandulosa HHB12029]|uniref:WD40 repeat-like protein n=1 Tax=Exidia glandulosa HHB12029 TaxID=1314781 RepID=A0A165R1V5_EXIGL|nr:WD40 repeat-like protein [Exidia glandulosa HHB12029]
MSSTTTVDAKPTPPAPTYVPEYASFAARHIIPPNFAAWGPRNARVSSKDAVLAVSWSCDGKYLASCGYERTVRVWQPERSMEVRGTTSLSGGHSTHVECISWHPTHPELLCSASRKDMKVAFWDVRQSKPIQNFALTRRPLSIQYSPTGKRILMLDDDDRLSFIKLDDAASAEGKPQWTYNEPAKPAPGTIVAMSAVWAHTGEAIFLGGTDGSIRVIEYPSLEVLDKTTAHVGHCYALALDPRGKYLATGGADSIVSLIDLEQWLPVRAFSSTETTVNALSFSHDGEYLAIAGDHQYVELVASETGQVMHRVPGVTAAQSVAWHPSKHILAYCGEHAPDPKVGWISVFGS